MASSTQFSSTRLQPIVELLDKEEYKQALKLIKPLLEKQPEDGLVKSMKALALYRSGHSEESLRLCKEVQNARPTDRDVIDLLLQIFSMARKETEAIACYETAWMDQPANEDLAIGLFVTILRTEHFVRAQQVATRMWKQFKKRRYYFWAVICITLQVTSIGPNRLLELAERMLEKLVSDNEGFVSAEELRVFLGILVQQGNMEKAINVVNSEMGAAFQQSRYRLRMVAELQLILGHFKDAELTYRRLVWEEDPLDWSHVRGCIDAILHIPPRIPCANPFGSSVVNLATLSGALRGIAEADVLLPQGEMAVQMDNMSVARELVRHVGEKDRRTGMLASLYVEARLSEFGSDIQQQQARSSIVTLLVDYKRMFGGRDACYADILPFLRYVPDDQFLSLCEELKRPTPGSSLTCDQAAAHEVVVLRTSFLRDSDRDMGTDSMKALIGRLSEQYVALMDDHTAAKGGDTSMANNTATMLCVTIARHLTRFGCRNQGTLAGEAALLDAATLLEYERNLQPHQYLSSLVLIRVYCRLGCFSPCRELFEGLSVKNVLAESMLYLVLDDALRLGAWRTHLSLAASLSQLHRNLRDHHLKLLQAPLANESFSRVGEIIAFHERLKRSALLAAVVVERLLSMVISKDAQSLDVLAQMFEGKQQVFDEQVQPLREASFTQNLERHDDADILPDFEIHFGSPVVVGTAYAVRDPVATRVYIRARAVLLDSVRRVVLVHKGYGAATFVAGSAAALQSIVDELYALPVTVEPLEQMMWEANVLQLQISEALLCKDDTSLGSSSAKGSVVPISATDPALSRLNSVLTASRQAVWDGKESSAARFTEGWLRKLAVLVGEIVGFSALLMEVWVNALPPKKSKKSHKSPWKEVRAAVFATAAVITKELEIIGDGCAAIQKQLEEASNVDEAWTLPALPGLKLARAGVMEAVRNGRIASVEAFAAVVANRLKSVSRLG